MNRSITGVAMAAALLAAVPALAHGSHTGGSHATHELQEKVTRLSKDITKDNRALTADEQKLTALQIQAAEAKAGKAPPLSSGQQRELAELQERVVNLKQDVGRDTARLTADQAKVKAWQEHTSP
jgi:uncharacterized coiled-coil protein SlyX